MANLLDYSTWTLGTGSTTGFSATGNASVENERLYAADPWGKQAIVWEVTTEDDTGYGGGWHTGTVPVDYNYMYRFSAYTRRLGESGERDLFGCNVYNASSSMLNLTRKDNASTTTNVYFDYWYGGATYFEDWMLMVVFVWPYGTSLDGVNHPHTGIWRVSDGVKAATPEDWVFVDTNTTKARQRLFYYDSTDKLPGFISHYIYPRIEKCDGTELPIQWLFRGPNAILLGKATGLGNVLIGPKEWH